MGKPQIVDQNNSVLLNAMGKDAYHFYVVDLKDEILMNDAKIINKFVEVRTQFSDLKCQPFIKIKMPKSINH